MNNAPVRPKTGDGVKSINIPANLGFNMSRDKTEYQISKIGHVQHSRLVLRHAIQMILYGRIIDFD